jgi:hypothetical protein
MKINKKALKLIDKGLSSKTVSKLTESQINVLHSKLLGEQVTEVPNKKTYEVGPKGGEVNGVVISQDPSTKKVMVTTKEGEIDEEEEVTLDPNKDTETQDPHQVGPSSDDGFGDETDGMGMMEEKDGPNPWAICHSQVGPKKSRKWERCVREVKKQLKEGKNPVSLFLETQIERIVEKHIPPRITKGDLMKVLSESEPTTAPTKPKTKPTTKPTTRPSHPGKNPNPGENPAPKAKKSETKEQQTAPAPTTKPAPTKPGTRPDTKPRPSHPGKNPNPGENPAPKAKKVSPEQAKDSVIDVIMNLLKK